ncbi:hemerythrin domain-containing protein [Candidatus Woesearchaeota archaeon]|nr:hemerythrin domain-containing protein [Candidatus Woesearchaeota archaeon]
MEKATKILSDEHQNILTVLSTLEKECSNMEVIDKLFFNKVISFIRNYSDKFHHAKEEDLLFKELGKVEMHCDPTKQMLYEHDIGRNLVKQLEEALNNNNVAQIKLNSNEFIQLLREHIHKEDNILYPMADEALTLNQQEFLLSEFNKINNQNIQIYIDFVEECKNRI